MSMRTDDVFAILSKRIDMQGATPSQIQEAVNKYLSENPVDSVTEANILKALGYTPADQEEVKELNKKLVQYVKSVNGFTPDENGEVILKFPRTTDIGYRHSELSGHKKITVYDNGINTISPRVFLGKNYWPLVKYLDGKFTQHGITLETDEHNITLIGTATTGAMFTLCPDESGESYWEIPSDIAVGDQMKLYVFGEEAEQLTFFCKIRVYDENKNYISQVQSALSAGKSEAVVNYTIPSGAKYFQYMCAYSNGMSYDHTLFPVFVKANTEVINKISFEDGIAECETNNQTSDICTAIYKCSVEYEQELKKYIDYSSNNIDFDLTDIHRDMSFITPEMFGAYSDGKHDDTVAVQACIDYAIEKNCKIIGGGDYRTSEPIVITANSCSIDIHAIHYSGSDVAVIVNGSRNAIRITEILATNGVGFRLNSDIASNYNNFYIGRIYSGSNCVEYIQTSKDILCNSMVFGLLESWSGFNCIYQSEEILGSNIYMNNNNFTGGKLSGGKWGVYGAKGSDSYITCHFENVDNCLMMNGIGVCRLISPRYAEVKNNQTGSDGKVFAIESPYGSEPFPYDSSKVSQVVIEPHGGYITPFNVDITKASIEVFEKNGSVVPIAKGYPGAGIVRCDLITRSTSLIAKEFMTFGRHILIKEPAYYRTKSVTVSDVGYVGDYRDTDTEDEFDIYSRFIIEESGCDYTLPPSYDVIAFDKFIVEQTEGTSCIFRDWRETIIFDGAQYGAGLYEVQATIGSYTGDTYDNENQRWEIRRMSDYSLVDTMPHNAQ